MSGYDVVNRLLSDWTAARATARAFDESLHPDITDRFGRVWKWTSHNSYSHDDTLAFDPEQIERAGLPLARMVAANPNYYQLCAICTSEWSQDERDELARTVEEHRERYGEHLWPRKTTEISGDNR